MSQHRLQGAARRAPRHLFAAALCVATLGAAGPFASALGAAEPPPAEELLARSIAYHDPEGIWDRANLRLSLSETRPKGSDRKTVFDVHRGGEVFSYRSEREDRVVEATVREDDCTMRLDGSETFSEEDQKRYRLTCDGQRWVRNYYAYVWGLPMKLRDPGTHLAPETEVTTFQGREVYALKVTYDPEVGKDTWTFYLEPETAALVGYRFFHDQAANDGEYIVLEGEVRQGALRLPARRSWYFNKDDQFLGADILDSLEITSDG